MKLKLKKIAAALAACGLALGFSSAQAQKLSDDKIVIGFITDMSSLYSDIDGPGGVEAIRMAIADMQQQFPGKKIEVVFADHQNKADIASSKVARVDRPVRAPTCIIGGTNSATALAMREGCRRKEASLSSSIGAATFATDQRRLHAVHDPLCLRHGGAGQRHRLRRGEGRRQVLVLPDRRLCLRRTRWRRTRATSSRRLAARWSARCARRLNASDFSSFLLQAQNSKAQILGLANAGGDTINSIKAANEFGVTKTMKLAGLLMFINDIHSLGLKTTAGHVPDRPAGTGT